MMRLALWSALILLAGSGVPGAALETQSQPAEELKAAIDATFKKGFTYVIRPAASLSEFNRAREAMAGVPVRGECAGGTYHATDGTYEIYRQGAAVAIRGGKGKAGWMPHDQFLSPFQVEMKQAFGDGESWHRGNVTKGRNALGEIIQIEHLMRRADLGRVLNLAEAFKGIRRAGAGKSGAAFSGELTPAVAFEVLQGPFEELVRRKILAFSNPSGIGKITVQNGVVKTIYVKAAGTYLYCNEDDNIRKDGMAVLEISGEVTKAGETKVEPPAEAMQVLRSGKK
jgi:hypothetical protein